MFFIGAGFVLILLAAAASDLIHYRIPNVLVLALGSLFIVSASLHFADAAWLDHIAAAALCLAAGFALYQFGQLGAGDVKLLSAVALWTGMGGLVALLLFTSLSGLLVLAMILFARFLVSRAKRTNLWQAQWSTPRVLTKKQGVPYGVAIALGGILTMAMHPASFG